jgi:hypothetical protein
VAEAAMTAADVAYVRAGFVPLDELCAARGEDAGRVRSLVAGGRLPGPSYVLPDGTAMVPRDFFALADAAGGAEPARELFVERYLAAGGDAAGAEAEWTAYLSGAYGVCLRTATPEHILRKGELVDEIDALIGAPRPGDEDWRARLRAAVDELDELERPFAPAYDRARWGPSSRDRCITGPRRRNPELFAEPAAVPAG